MSDLIFLQILKRVIAWKLISLNDLWPGTVKFNIEYRPRHGQRNLKDMWEQRHVSLYVSVQFNTCCITKTYLYNFDPLKPHFYIVKLGFTGVYISFLISAQNINCGYLLEPPRWGGSNEYPQSMFWAEILKISELLSEIFHFFGCKIFYVFE